MVLFLITDELKTTFEVGIEFKDPFQPEYEDTVAQKGQTQISLPKHKTVSQNTNQFPKTQIGLPKHKSISQNTNQFTKTQKNFLKTNQFSKTQISLPKHKSISQNTNQFRETQIKRLGTFSVIIREPGRDSFPRFSASNMATSNMLSERSKMFCHNCESKELQEYFYCSQCGTS